MDAVAKTTIFQIFELRIDRCQLASIRKWKKVDSLTPSWTPTMTLNCDGLDNKIGHLSWNFQVRNLHWESLKDCDLCWFIPSSSSSVCSRYFVAKNHPHLPWNWHGRRYSFEWPTSGPYRQYVRQVSFWCDILVKVRLRVERPSSVHQEPHQRGG